MRIGKLPFLGKYNFTAGEPRHNQPFPSGSDVASIPACRVPKIGLDEKRQVPHMIVRER